MEVVLYTLAPLAASLYGGLITAYRPPSDHLRSVSDHTDEAERRQRFPDSEPNRSCRYSNKSYPRSLRPFKRMFMIVLMAIVMIVVTHILGSVGGYGYGRDPARRRTLSRFVCLRRAHGSVAYSSSCFPLFEV